MKSTFVLATIVVGAYAQCKTVAQAQAEIASNPNPDPFKLLDPKLAVFPCNMGASVPLGKIPQGCGQLEFIYGSY
jgi:hypothetical protein